MTYAGSLTEDLIRTVERVTGKEIPRTGDKYLDLAEVKTVIADRPMDIWDQIRWEKADYLQNEILREGLCSE